MTKKYSSTVIISIILIVLIVVTILVFVAIKARPAFFRSSVPTSNNKPNTNESTVQPVTNWTTYHSSACGISYAIPQGWVSQGWATNNEIINLSSPNDLRKDEINTKTSDAGPPPPPSSFYVNCMDDVAIVFDGQNKNLIENGSTVEAALAKGFLRNLKDARYLNTIEVVGQKAFVYEMGNASSGPGMHYDSVFVYLNNKWMEIRPSMTRFADITQDQRGILDSIKILDTK